MSIGRLEKAGVATFAVLSVLTAGAFFRNQNSRNETENLARLLYDHVAGSDRILNTQELDKALHDLGIRHNPISATDEGIEIYHNGRTYTIPADKVHDYLNR